jgi:RHS repeat-associated protein
VLGNLTYTYDATGNRTQVGGTWARTGIPSSITTTNYDAANRQLTFGDKTLTYDNNGNLTSILDASGTTLYTWNARNQLGEMSGSGTNANFVYDGLGRREKKTINGSLTEFLYDGVNPVQETSGATVLANILSGLNVDEFFARNDLPAATTSLFLPDALGSALALTDPAGSVQTEYSYEPFGKTSVTGVFDNNSYQFTGRENDGTGLSYYRARYYHPTLQRFIAEDPIDFLGGDVNLYAYLWNSPVDLIDPTGTAAGPPGMRLSPECWQSRPICKSFATLPSDLLWTLQCDPFIDLLPIGMVRGPTAAMVKQFERQLARDGLKSLEKSLRSFERNLAEHIRDLARYAERGGYTSSVETEIRNFEAQIETIKQVIGSYLGR